MKEKTDKKESAKKSEKIDKLKEFEAKFTELQLYFAYKTMFGYNYLLCSS